MRGGWILKLTTGGGRAGAVRELRRLRCRYSWVPAFTRAVERGVCFRGDDRGFFEDFFRPGRGKRDQPLVALGVSFCLLDRDLLGRRRIVGSLGDFATGLPGDGARLAAGEGA